MKSLTPRQLLDLAAQQGVEGSELETRLLSLVSTLTPPSSPSGREESEKKEEKERNYWMQTLRTKPALVILVLLLTLALISGAAYALGRSMGYIPGVGLIEQGTPIRVLAAPLSQTRAGVTLTIQEAVLTTDRTVIVMTWKNLPYQALSHPEDTPFCYETPQLRLPDGEVLRITAGRASANAQGELEVRWIYAPIPPAIDGAELLVPCTEGALSGQAPENWLFKLRFIPAPPEMTVLPVQELPTPSPAPATQLAAGTSAGWQIEKVIETDEGYLLVGTFHLSDLPHQATLLGFSEWPIITDASGNEIFALPVSDLDDSSATPGEFPWSLEIKGKQHDWPLTLRVKNLNVETAALSTQFRLDVGENPRQGEEWTLNQTLQLGEWQIDVLRVRFTGKGYEFDLRVPPSSPIQHVGLEILGATPQGGFGSSDDQGNIQAGLEFDNPPRGQITVRVNSVLFRLQGDWTIQWMPEDAPSGQSLFGIRLVLDKTVELEDGYFLIGHLEWEDGRIAMLTPAAPLLATDAQGNPLELEEVSFDVFSQLVSDFSNSRWQFWAYRLKGKDFSFPISLHLKRANLMLSSPVKLSLDLSPYGFAFDEAHLGLPYKMGLIPLEGLPELSARLVRVTYLRQGELHGFDLYWEADPRLDGLSFQIETAALEGTGNTLIESYRDERSGLLVTRTLCDAKLTSPFSLIASDIQIRGGWTIQWWTP